MADINCTILIIFNGIFSGIIGNRKILESVINFYVIFLKTKAPFLVPS